MRVQTKLRPKSEQAKRIRELNDTFRRTFQGGRVMQTSGFAALPDPLKQNIIAAIQAFDAFDTGNDPHGEHDFCSVEVEGVTAFWKVDYYNIDERFLSDDPGDPAITKRVATIMLASEY